MIAQLVINLDGEPCFDTTRMQVKLVLSDSEYVLALSGENLSRLTLAYVIAFVQPWITRANESRIQLSFGQDVVTEIFFAAYWACKRAEIRVRNAGTPGMVVVEVCVDGEKPIVVDFLNLLDAPERAAEWMTWAADNADPAFGFAFFYDSNLKRLVPDSFPATVWAARAIPLPTKC